MKVVRVVLATMAMLLACCEAGAGPGPIGFDAAKWIWHAPGFDGNLGSLTAGVIFFRAEMPLPDKAEVSSAEVIITCDNLFSLYLNGLGVGECEANNNAWGTPQRYDVSSQLKPGRNVMAVVGNLENATDTRHAAAEALGQIGDPASLEPMQLLAADYPEVSTRRALLEACENVTARRTVGNALPGTGENYLTRRD